MLSWLPKPIVGVIGIILYLVSLLFCSLIIYLFALCKLIFKGRKGYIFFEKIGLMSSRLWAYMIDGIVWLTTRTVWEIDDTQHLSTNQWYFLISNHQSWADIIILVKIFIRKTPMIKFFLKKELIWMPLVGTLCWCLNFPFMKRHSKAFLEKNPHLQGQDLATTQKACEVYQLYPATLTNFVEGTRYTPEKHQLQQSPYKHLLKPKAGGVAFTLAAMNGTLKELIDATIIYQDTPSAWDFFCGRTQKIIVKFTTMAIPDDLIGDYQNDPAFRERFQRWLNERWHEKDLLIDTIITQKALPHETAKQ